MYSKTTTKYHYSLKTKLLSPPTYTLSLPFVGCDLNFYICLKSLKCPGSPQKWFKPEPGTRTVLQNSSHRHSKLERDQEAPIMDMLNHLPFCKNPKLQDRVNHQHINPNCLLPVRSLTVARHPDESSLLIINLTPRRKSDTGERSN